MFEERNVETGAQKGARFCCIGGGCGTICVLAEAIFAIRQLVKRQIWPSFPQVDEDTGNINVERMSHSPIAVCYSKYIE
jgi:hypothetical protein